MTALQRRSTPTLRRRLLLAVAFVVLVVGLVVVYSVWKRGTPYQAQMWSPNGRYYVQKFSNISPSRLIPGMPGQGSDAIDGYLRLYDREGRLLHERYEHFIRDIEPLWAGTKVYLRGVAAMDDNPWTLPSSAE